MQEMLTKNVGFTLVELIVTVAIAGILVGLAIPSFTSIIRSNRLTTYTNEFVTALNLARSEAIKRGEQVTITRKSATEKVWEEGWDVFVDIKDSPVGNTLNTFDDDDDSTLCETNDDGSPKEDCRLRTYDALPSGFYIRSGGTTYKDYASYLPGGIKGNDNTGDTFTVCYGSAGATESREITLNFVGRSNVKTAEASPCPAT
jgi:type IV fimbrial biogenesis protein FimT